MQNKKVLFVDDEEMILKSIQRGLMNEPYKKFYATNAEQALMILGNNDIAVMVTDLKMSGMGGLDLLKKVKELYPDVIRIVLTGYSKSSVILKAINTGHIYRQITKPWKKTEDFIPTIRQAIEYHQIIEERKQLVERLTQKNKSLEEKNIEILHLKELAETSDQNKTEILNYITKEFIPYMEGVIQATYEMKGINNTKINQIIGDLNERGVYILNILNAYKMFQP